MMNRSPTDLLVPDVGRAARAGVTGALGFLAVALAQAADPVAPGAAGFAIRSVASTVAALLLVGAVAALARCGVAGGGLAAWIGLAAVAVGWVTVAAAQVASQIGGSDATMVFVVATALHVFGMLPVAVAALRARVRPAPTRLLPLLCALYPLGALPLFGLPGAGGHLAVAGWGGCWLLLALRLHQYGHRQRRSAARIR